MMFNCYFDYRLKKLRRNYISFVFTLFLRVKVKNVRDWKFSLEHPVFLSLNC